MKPSVFLPDPGAATYGDEATGIEASLGRIALGVAVASDDPEFRRLMGLAHRHRVAAAKLEAEAGMILSELTARLPR